LLFSPFVWFPIIKNILTGSWQKLLVLLIRYSDNSKALRISSIRFFPESNSTATTSNLASRANNRFF